MSYSVYFSFYMMFSFLAILLVRQCVLLFFHLFQCFSPHFTYVFLIFNDFQFSRHTPGSILFISHFPRIYVFLSILQVKHCLCLIFHVFQYSHHIPGFTVCISHFSRFHCFLPYSRSYSVFFFFFFFCTLFSVSCNTLGPTM